MTGQAGDIRSYVKLSIWVLAIDWIAFGSMHFFYLSATVAQIPQGLPFPHAIAIVTGIIEVATGLLILLPSTRKWAAMSSLGVLILLIPAVIYILWSPAPLDAIHVTGWVRTLLLVGLVPHNVLLGICSILVLRYPQ
ncbi:MAG: hypothetical protein ABI810_12720 [Sphingomonas bacterium]